MFQAPFPPPISPYMLPPPGPVEQFISFFLLYLLLWELLLLFACPRAWGDKVIQVAFGLPQRKRRMR